MGFIRTLARAAILWGQENALDVLSAVVLPCTNSAVTRMLGRTPSRWITRNLWNVRTLMEAFLVDGSCSIGRQVSAPEGPAEGQLARSRHRERTAHSRWIHGVIASGYGKGTKHS